MKQSGPFPAGTGGCSSAVGEQEREGVDSPLSRSEVINSDAVSTILHSFMMS
jgi:hypothetical protein